MVAHICTSLNHRIDAIVDCGDGYDFDIIPGHPSVREPGEDMEPDSYVSRIFASHPLSLNIIDGLDSRVLLDDKAYLQRRATHDESCVWNVRYRIFADHFKPGRPLVGEIHFHGVDHTKVDLAAIEQRQEGAGPRVGLNPCLKGRGAAYQAGQTTG